MLPLVIPEILYWIICEKSVIEPTLTGGQELYSPFFRRVIGIDDRGPAQQLYYLLL
jgi:hypothetical protein